MKLIKHLFFIVVALVLPLTLQVLGMLAYGTYLGLAFDHSMDQVQTLMAEHSVVIVAMSGLVLMVLYLIGHKVIKFETFKAFSFKGLSASQLKWVFIASCFMLLFSLNFHLFFDLSRFDPETAESLDTLFMDKQPLMTFLAIGIIVPFVEEFMFRGVIFKHLRAFLSLRLAIVVQALLFGLYHMNIIQAPTTAFLGIVAASAMVITRSFWAAFLVHAINNGVSVLIYFLSQLIALPETEQVVTITPYQATPLVMMCLLMVATLWAIKKLKKHSPNPQVLLTIDLS